MGFGVSLHDSNLGSLMSALGQKQTLRHLQPMSALPPKADIGTWSRNVRFVREADIQGRCSRRRTSNGPCLERGSLLPRCWRKTLVLPSCERRDPAHRDSAVWSFGT